MAQVITSPSTAYAIGSTLTVSPANQTPGTDVDDLTLRITDHIFVGYGRACQVFLVEILDGTLPKAQPTIGPERYFVKLFDPEYATSEHDPWNEGPEAACRRIFDREAGCYRRLEPLQGIHVPILHGEYLFEAKSQQKPMPLLVMQYLSARTINHFFRASAETLSKLEAAAFSALAALHSHDVCHNDVHCGNILWQLEEDKVWFVDFGSGIWPKPELDMRFHRADDEANLRASLRDLGWVDTEPQKKPPCIGIDHYSCQCHCFTQDNLNS